MEQIATPALETPLGLLLVFIVGLIFAVEFWRNRESIDLLFFRLSGGNRRIGHAAALAVPPTILAATAYVVLRLL